MVTGPYIALERDSGDIYVHQDENELRKFAEEFWDILTTEFVCFDSTGQRLDLPHTFLRGNGLKTATTDEQEVLALYAALERVAREKQITWSRRQPIAEFIEKYLER